MTQARCERRALTAHPWVSHFLPVSSAPLLRAPRLPLTLLAVDVARRRQEAGPGRPEKQPAGAQRPGPLPSGGRAGLGTGAGDRRAWAGRPRRPAEGLHRSPAGEEGWPLRREAGVLSWRGEPFLLVIVQRRDHPCSGSRAPQTAPWVTVMTSTIEGAGTSLEESAATMIVLGREMKDVEGTIGMTGMILPFLSFVPSSHWVALHPDCISRIIVLGRTMWNRLYLSVSCGSTYLVLAKEPTMA